MEEIFKVHYNQKEAVKAYCNVLNKLKKIFEELDEKEKVVMIDLIGDEKAKKLILFNGGNFRY